MTYGTYMISSLVYGNLVLFHQGGAELVDSVWFGNIFLFVHLQSSSSFPDVEVEKMMKRIVRCVRNGGCYDTAPPYPTKKLHKNYKSNK